LIRDLTAGDIIWRRRPPSLKPAMTLLEDALSTRLREWAEANWPADQPVFAFGLGTSRAFPFDVAPGLLTVDQRDEALSDPDESGVAMQLWNPAEYAIYDPDFELKAPGEVLEAQRLLAQEVELTDDEGMVPRLLGRVAKRLAEGDWAHSRRDPEFVVFAIDMDIENQQHVERALRAALPRELFRAFKKRGWLHVAG
jgi:hypothetical protein